MKAILIFYDGVSNRNMCYTFVFDKIPFSSYLKESTSSLLLSILDS